MIRKIGRFNVSESVVSTMKELLNKSEEDNIKESIS